MYRGDCAFELARYRLAAELYDQAARRYADHHASMHALVQIVNCFDRLGETTDADIAHRNALTRLRQLPDDAFDDPGALMDRAAWERWLQNRPVGIARSGAPALD
jgi:tetratricopeptide (TPR) repeat protein